MSVRSSSPVQELWSSILDSVSSTRSISSKSILVLGEPETGKSTVVKALLKKPQDEVVTGDFALGYGWTDVKDDADEDTLARLSVYTVPSSAPSHLALVNQFLPPRASLPHCLIMIVLDWTRPWSFVSQLEKWLGWVERWSEGDKSRELQLLREEGRERLQLHIQQYAEPGSTDASNPVSLSTTLLPLGPGVLTNNTAGVPIIVVCTKADLIDESRSAAGGPMQNGGMGGLSKGSIWEERQDAVMQVLRTICLKYGAALFYTTPAPQTLATLRSYALHLLFTPTPVAPNEPLPRNPFPFSQRANTLDRDRIVIPVGWDSWGKINIVREDFDTRRWSEGWDSDLSKESSAETGAEAWFTQIIRASEDAQATGPAQIVLPKPEQTFLAAHYETLQKERDPRATFRQPTAVNAPGTGHEAGVVGPLGSSSFNLPSVEKAMQELEGEEADRRQSITPMETPRPSVPSAARDASLRPPPAPRQSLAADGGPRSPGATPSTQHEVLQNFFQSLLGPNRREGGAARTVSQAQPRSQAQTSAPSLPASQSTPTGGPNGTLEGEK